MDPHREWLDPLESRAWRAWIQTGDVVRAQLARDLQQLCGLSDADYAVLVHVSERPDHRIRMSDLAAGLRWSKSRLSHQVGRMEVRGLLRREECPSDARGSFAVLTPCGLREIEAAAPHHVASVRRHFIDRLDRGQLAALAAIGDSILAGAPCPGVEAVEGDCPEAASSCGADDEVLVADAEGDETGC